MEPFQNPRKQGYYAIVGFPYIVIEKRICLAFSIYHWL